VNPIKDEHGNLEKFVSIQALIHETKQKAIENDIRLEAIAESNIVVDWSPDGSLMNGNGLFIRCLGYDGLDHLHSSNLHLDQCITAEDHEQLKQGKAIRNSIVMKTVKGDHAFLDVNITPIYDCLLYTSPSPRDRTRTRMPSSA